jgi:hypothetical protein
MMMSKINDSMMPAGWHTIKSTLLVEMQTATNFHHCVEVANSLFHARLIGQGIAEEVGTKLQNNSTVGCFDEEVSYD